MYTHQWDDVFKQNTIESVNCEANVAPSKILHTCTLECKTGYQLKKSKGITGDQLLCKPKGSAHEPDIKFNQRCVKKKRVRENCRGKLCKLGITTGSDQYQMDRRDFTGYFFHKVTNTNPLTGQGKDERGNFVLSAGQNGYAMKKTWENGDVANVNFTKARRFEGNLTVNGKKNKITGSVKPKKLESEVISLINGKQAIGQYSGKHEISMAGTVFKGYFWYELTSVAPLAGHGFDETGPFTLSPGDDGYFMKKITPDGDSSAITAVTQMPSAWRF